jgi:hypothetical protein
MTIDWFESVLGVVIGLCLVCIGFMLFSAGYLAYIKDVQGGKMFEVRGKIYKCSRVSDEK